MKRLNYEWQSPELAKGEVVLRKEISSLGKETLTLKSHEDVCVRSDEITLKQQRDLGVFTNVVSGQQPSSQLLTVRMAFLLIIKRQLLLHSWILFRILWKV